MIISEISIISPVAPSPSALRVTKFTLCAEVVSSGRVPPTAAALFAATGRVSVRMSREGDSLLTVEWKQRVVGRAGNYCRKKDYFAGGFLCCELFFLNWIPVGMKEDLPYAPRFIQQSKVHEPKPVIQTGILIDLGKFHFFSSLDPARSDNDENPAGGVTDAVDSHGGPGIGVSSAVRPVSVEPAVRGDVNTEVP